MESTLFTELTVSEQATVSGGVQKTTANQEIDAKALTINVAPTTLVAVQVGGKNNEIKQLGYTSQIGQNIDAGNAALASFGGY